MTTRLFCEHCKKYYKVNLQKVNLIKKYKEENIRFSNNTYYYKNSCFFKDVTALKQQIQEN